MSEWGAACQGTLPAAGFFSEESEGAHINELELTASLHGLESFIEYARAKHLLLMSDSKVTTQIVTNYTSRSQMLLNKLRALRALCERHGITVSTRHLQSVLNCWAERLSRRRDAPNWGLSRDAQRLFQRRFATPLFHLDGNSLPSRSRRPPTFPSSHHALLYWASGLEACSGVTACLSHHTGPNNNGSSPCASFGTQRRSKRRSRLPGRQFSSTSCLRQARLERARNRCRCQVTVYRGGAAGAAFLLGRRLTSTTQGNYQRHWEVFADFCFHSSEYALPACPQVICCYLGHLFDKSTVQGGPIRPYVAAIRTQNRHHGLKYPTAHPLVVSTRRGYFDKDSARWHGPPKQSALLPADAALVALHRAITSRSDDVLRRCCLVAAGYLICSRPTSIRMVGRLDVQLEQHYRTLQVTLFKYCERGSSPRIAPRISLARGWNDPVARLFRRLSAVVPSPTACIFDSGGGLPPSTASFRWSVAKLVGTTLPPAFMRLSTISPRSGRTSAVYAAGIPLEEFMRLLSTISTSLCRIHWLDGYFWALCAQAARWAVSLALMSIHAPRFCDHLHL